MHPSVFTLWVMDVMKVSSSYMAGSAPSRATCGMTSVDMKQQCQSTPVTHIFNILHYRFIGQDTVVLTLAVANNYGGLF
jgi:hypothetical protein